MARPHLRRVIQIVSGSRTGSTYLKYLLEQCPELCSLAGEVEPYFAATGNGYGHNSSSDALSVEDLKNPTDIFKMVLLELFTGRNLSGWKQRLELQYSGPFLTHLILDLAGSENLNNVLSSTDEVYAWMLKHRILGNYDLSPRSMRLPFDGKMVSEMRPYVIPKESRVTETLLLKSPYCTFRPDVLEKVFSQMEFSRIYIVRHPCAVINGLYDGWKANYGYHRHLTPYGWWKFEMPPGWEEYATASIWDKCMFQWFEATSAILSIPRVDGRKAIIVKYEDLASQPQRGLDVICRKLDLTPPTLGVIPNLMSTESPDPDRWKKRADSILPLFRKESLELAKAIGYTLEK